MALINSDSKLSEIILHDASTITVLDRFGIALGVGDATVGDACRTHGIDIKFFTTILNTYINENYFPQEALEQFSVAEIVDYLSKTNDYYVQNVLPNIERHFSFLISRAPSHNNNLVLMRQFFDEMKSELMMCQPMLSRTKSTTSSTCSSSTSRATTTTTWAMPWWSLSSRSRRI